MQESSDTVRLVYDSRVLCGNIASGKRRTISDLIVSSSTVRVLCSTRIRRYFGAKCIRVAFKGCLDCLLPNSSVLYIVTAVGAVAAVAMESRGEALTVPVRQVREARSVMHDDSESFHDKLRTVSNI